MPLKKQFLLFNIPVKIRNHFQGKPTHEFKLYFTLELPPVVYNPVDTGRKLTSWTSSERLITFSLRPVSARKI